MLQVQHLSVQYGSHTVVDDTCFDLTEGQWLMVIGPNGAGKTTLISAMAQSVPYKGAVLFEGENIAKWKPLRLARHLGVLMQSNNPTYSFTVEEVVRMGRYAYSSGLLPTPSPRDDEAVEQALEDTGMTALRGKSVLALSGGEVQRTFLAQLLAQDPRVMILDEPANHLDLVYQKQLFELVARWVKKPGRAAISVVHDLSLARAYGSHALVMNEGKTAALGPVAGVMTQERLREVYSIDVYGWMHRMLGQWEAPDAPAPPLASPLP